MKNLFKTFALAGLALLTPLSTYAVKADKLYVMGTQVGGFAYNKGQELDKKSDGVFTYQVTTNQTFWFAFTSELGSSWNVTNAHRYAPATNNTTPQTGENAMSYGVDASWQLPAGTYNMTIDTNNMKLILGGEVVFEIGDLYLRGAFNDYAAQAAWKFTKNDDVYTLSDVTIPANSAFKVGNADWSFSCTVPYEERNSIEFGKTYTYVKGGMDNDMSFSAEQTGVTITVDTKNETILFTKADTPNPPTPPTPPVEDYASWYVKLGSDAWKTIEGAGSDYWKETQPNAEGVATFTALPFSNLEFAVSTWNGKADGYLYAADIVPGTTTTLTVATTQTASTIAGAAEGDTYDVTIDVKNNTILLTKVGGDTPNPPTPPTEDYSSWYVKIGSDAWKTIEGAGSDYWKETQPNAEGVATFTALPFSNLEFAVSTWNGKADGYLYAADIVPGTTTTLTVATTQTASTIAGAAEGDTYDVTIDVKNNTILLTKVGGDTPNPPTPPTEQNLDVTFNFDSLEGMLATNSSIPESTDKWTSDSGNKCYWVNDVPLTIDNVTIMGGPTGEKTVRLYVTAKGEYTFRVNKTGNFNVAAPEGYSITKIVLMHNAKSHVNKFTLAEGQAGTFDKGTNQLTDGYCTATYTNEDGIGNVTFTNPSSAARVSKINVILKKNTVEPTPGYEGWYVNIGSDNWKTGDGSDYYKGVEVPESGIVEYENLPLGKDPFALYVYNTKADMFYSGENIQMDTPTELAFAGEGQENWKASSIEGAADGDIFNVTYNVANNEITIKKVGSAPTPELSDLYLRGAITGSDWPAVEDYRFAIASEGVYTLSIPKLAGEFKIATSTWGSQYSTKNTNMVPGETYTVETYDNIANMGLAKDATDVTLTLDTKANTLKITGTTVTEEIVTWVLHTNMNQPLTEQMWADNELNAENKFSIEAQRDEAEMIIIKKINGTPKNYYKVDGVEVDLTQLKQTETATVQFAPESEASNDLKIKAATGYTYTFTLNPETMVLTISAGYSGIDGITIDEMENAVYYNLRGVKVANPDKGVFIRVANGKSTKVVK
ncbi:MAG: hypothetical protein NC204_01915 [Candidatus Amulumruptor caecigallinarius]|nr:hypothetical protein [Candidatus Amulumruptor caecigallinarius]